MARARHRDRPDGLQMALHMRRGCSRSIYIGGAVGTAAGSHKKVAPHGRRGFYAHANLCGPIGPIVRKFPGRGYLGTDPRIIEGLVDLACRGSTIFDGLYQDTAAKSALQMQSRREALQMGLN